MLFRKTVSSLDLNKLFMRYGLNKYCLYGLVLYTLFFFYKNIFYKNIKAEIREILRIF